MECGSGPISLQSAVELEEFLEQLYFKEAAEREEAKKLPLSRPRVKKAWPRPGTPTAGCIDTDLPAG
jgi:hypothetical protein